MTTVNRRGLARRAVPAISILLLGTMVAACDRSSGSSASQPHPERERQGGHPHHHVQRDRRRQERRRGRLDRELGDPQVHRGPEGQGRHDVPSSSSRPASDDEDYKTKIALDLKTGSGADIIALDGIWVGEFAEAGYIKPLDDVVGADDVDAWDGWEQIPKAGAGQRVLQGQALRRPGRHRRPGPLLQQEAVRAGRPAAPTGSRELGRDPRRRRRRSRQLRRRRRRSSSTPAPRWARPPRCRACCRCWSAPAQQIYDDGKWQGDTAARARRARPLPDRSTAAGLGDPVLQQDAKGRDKSFARVRREQDRHPAGGRLLLAQRRRPDQGRRATMADRDDDVGYAMIPAIRAGRRRQRPGLRVDVRRRRRGC